MDAAAAGCVVFVVVSTVVWSVRFETYAQQGQLVAALAVPLLGLAAAIITRRLTRATVLRLMVWCSLVVFFFTVLATLGPGI
jgi:hypothetical protein